MSRIVLPIGLLAVACTADLERTPTLGPLPDFADDCTEGTNESLDEVAGLQTDDGLVHGSVQLCEGDLDVYRIDVPPGQWVAVQITIDGSGRGGTDLDLSELGLDGEPLWASATEQDYERLAWYNPGAYPVARYLQVEGYQGAVADYDLEVRVSEFHDGVDCDAFFPDADPSDEGGPCNEILQFPRSERAEDGYFVEHQPHYSNLRREVTYLVRYAAQETFAAFPDTNPIALLDMSERDGGTPGAMVDSLRHPQGTHVYGNDIDIAYFQTGDDNAGRTVCPDNGYFCTGEPNLLDAERTAFFMAKLFESDHVRVIGVDPKIFEAIEPAAFELASDGLIDIERARDFDRLVAYGDGWPFHQHHLHFSWDWEDGHWRSDPPMGCGHVTEQSRAAWREVAR